MNDQHLLVALGEDRYALGIEWVCEVLRSSEGTAVPGAPPAVRGVLNLRGELLPALETATLLGLAERDRSAPIVVVEAGARRAGLAVRALIDVVSLPLGLEPSDRPLLLGSALLDGALIGVVDVPALLETASSGALA